jgi:hypothetical protein
MMLEGSCVDGTGMVSPMRLTRIRTGLVILALGSGLGFGLPLVFCLPGPDEATTMRLIKLGVGTDLFLIPLVTAFLLWDVVSWNDRGEIDRPRVRMLGLATFFIWTIVAVSTVLLVFYEGSRL